MLAGAPEVAFAEVWQDWAQDPLLMVARVVGPARMSPWQTTPMQLLQ